MTSLSKKVRSSSTINGKGGNKRKIGREEDEMEEEEMNEGEEDNFEAVLVSDQSRSESAWAVGGQHRDHIIQVLLNLVSNFGVYHSTPIKNLNKEQQQQQRGGGTGGGDVEEEGQEYQEVFFKSAYALENVNGLRQ